MEIQRSNAASVQLNQQADDQLRQSREEARARQAREESRVQEPAASKAPQGNQQVAQAPEVAKGTTATQGNRINTFA
ncbi:hypothetical protein [Chitinimonas sp. BJYL2]|uniref:hypothetical protein n=1 Tax=Chitinimonas sp. BJYL2 TaxID=2976696 RepID=UPI0022B52330|nr:hypothetical protein [Chitinimonas sp. BJYL2]